MLFCHACKLAIVQRYKIANKASTFASMALSLAPIWFILGLSRHQKRLFHDKLSLLF